MSVYADDVILLKQIREMRSPSDGYSTFLDTQHACNAIWTRSQFFPWSAAMEQYRESACHLLRIAAHLNKESKEGRLPSFNWQNKKLSCSMETIYVNARREAHIGAICPKCYCNFIFVVLGSASLGVQSNWLSQKSFLCGTDIVVEANA
jgi:hypothetical protein